MRKARVLLSVVAPVCLALVGLAGCQTARERALAVSPSRNQIFRPVAELPDLALEEGETKAFLEWERNDTQSVHVLLLASNAMREEGYHEEHNLTLVCIGGSAVVEIERERHLLQATDAVVIPRYYAYSIIPHEGDEDFAALLVYSPPWREGDWIPVDPR